MGLKHPKGPKTQIKDLIIEPIFVEEGIETIPRDRLPDKEIDPDLAYQIVHDELMLDGNARLNLATFVGT